MALHFGWCREGVVVYVLDTGCNAQHPEFEGRAIPGPSFVINDASDANGHGTHVTGTIIGRYVGVAKRATAVCVKVLPSQGPGDDASVIAGLDWAVRHAKSHSHPSVINMSLGGGASQAIDLAVQAAVGQGVLVVAAAGNDNIDACAVSPARVPAAVTGT
jgi:subtilisin family serine protease